MLYFIYTDLISRFFDPKLVDPGSTLTQTRWCILHMAQTIVYKLRCGIAKSNQEILKE